MAVTDGQPYRVSPTSTGGDARIDVATDPRSEHTIDLQSTGGHVSAVPNSAVMHRSHRRLAVAGNLPSGVTIEQFPPAITAASGQSSSASLRLRVASTVPLGTIVSGITITGSSGGVSRTSTIPTFTVVDPLLCSTYWGGNPCYG